MNSRILSVITAAAMFAPATALAAKPADVIQKSNGFPSGPHFNLNLHGKNPDTFTCDATTGGNSVFIPESGTSTIQYVSNKRASLTELVVLDPCGMTDPAKVQLPTKIVDDSGAVVDTSAGYYVFGRILSKPNNGSTGPSKIIVSQNVLVQACNDCLIDPDTGKCALDENGFPIPNPDFGTYTDCDLALGVITSQNLYVASDENFVRFDDSSSDTGKGKSTAKDITALFTFEGFVCDPILDTSGPQGLADGVIDLYDLPLTLDGDKDWDHDGDSGDSADLKAWLLSVPELATYYPEQWIFNIADLVVSEQGISNDGTKLFQVRFYPIATTTFTP